MPRSSEQQPLAETANDEEETTMAYLKGTEVWIGDMYIDWFDDDLPGYPEPDYIDGLGGNDNIWGNGGDDIMHGGAGIDWIWATDQNYVGAWGEDQAFGEQGDDELVFGANTDDVELWGGSGNDGIEGGSGNDHLYGGKYWNEKNSDSEDQDTIYGMGGNDYIDGGEDSDYIDGGDGNDHLIGGSDPYNLTSDIIYGRDGNDLIEVGGPWTEDNQLTGGSGHDTFVFWTNSWDHKPHHITDFQAYRGLGGAYDKISVPDGPDGTASNYDEIPMETGAGYDAAKSFATVYFASDFYIGGDLRYLFMTDRVDGYFFSDANGDGTLDNRVVLDGVNELSDFSYKNVVNDYDSPI